MPKERSCLNPFIATQYSTAQSHGPETWDNEGSYFEDITCVHLPVVAKRRKCRHCDKSLAETFDFRLWGECSKNVRHKCTNECHQNDEELEGERILWEVGEEFNCCNNPDEVTVGWSHLTD